MQLENEYFLKKIPFTSISLNNAPALFINNAAHNPRAPGLIAIAFFKFLL